MVDTIEKTQEGKQERFFTVFPWVEDALFTLLRGEEGEDSHDSTDGKTVDKKNRTTEINPIFARTVSRLYAEKENESSSKVA